MALFIRQQDSRTELQQRVAAELREKLKNEKPLEYEKPENDVIKGTHESRHLGPVAVIVVALVVLGLLYILSSR